jgi:hypothetical protein
MDNRNDEFWGHQYFVGENPPLDAVISFHLKQPVSDLRLRFTDASGKKVREIEVPSNRNQRGIQTVCWNLRLEPNPADAAGAGGRGGGRGGRGGPAGPPAVPGIPEPEPGVGYMPADPCGDAVGVGAAGFYNSEQPQYGPFVKPGSYSVALVAGEKTLDTKPMRIIMDPAVRLTEIQRASYDAVVTELYDAQRLGIHGAAALSALDPQMTAAAAKIRDASGVPATLKEQFDALHKDFDAVRVKFGVTATVAAGRGGGGGRGGDPENLVARTTTLKVGVMGIWEAPSAATVRQSAAVKLALQQAVTEANAMLAKATTMSQSLSKYDIVLTVPATIK